MDLKDLRKMMGQGDGTFTTAQLTGIRSLKGICGFPDSFKLQKDGIDRQAIMQGGPLAPIGGEMLVYNKVVDAKGWRVVGMIPAAAVKKFNLRPGDWIDGTAMGEQIVRVSNSREHGEIKLPALSDTLAMAGAFGAWGQPLLVNGKAPTLGPRRDWRNAVFQRDVHYPNEAYNLGADPTNTASQHLGTIGMVARGGKHIFAGIAGSGKTTLILSTIKAMVQNNPSIKFHFVITVYQERPEDTGDYMRAFDELFTDGVHLDEEHYIVRFSDHLTVEFIVSDTDNAMALHDSFKLAMIATARAERLAEMYAETDEEVDVVLVVDSGVRLGDTADMLQVGGKFASKTGGRDPFGLLVLGFVLHAGRSQYFRSEKRSNLTSIITLLIEEGNDGKRQLSAWTGEANATYILRPGVQNTTALPGGLLAWEACLVRHKEHALRPWVVVAQKRLLNKLATTQNGKRTTEESDGELVGLLYSGTGKDGNPTIDRESGGRAEAALKKFARDIAFPLDLERARQLIASGEVASNELASLDVLYDRLILPRSWVPQIWEELTKEGLVWPLDYLKAKELYLSGKLHTTGSVPKPRDLVDFLRDGTSIERAQQLWEWLIDDLGEEAVPTLYHIAWFLVEAGDKPEDSADLAKRMGIMPETAEQYIWPWLLDQGYEPPPPPEGEMVPVVAARETDLQAALRGSGGGGQLPTATPATVRTTAPITELSEVLSDELLDLIEEPEGRQSFVRNRAQAWAKELAALRASGHEIGGADFIAMKFTELAGFERDDIPSSERKNLARLLPK